MNLVIGLIAVLAAALAAFAVAFVPAFVAGMFGVPSPTSWWLTSLPAILAGLVAALWTGKALDGWRERRAQSKSKGSE